MMQLRKLELLLSQGRITRREFITQAAALGLSLTASKALFPRQVEAAIPKKGGYFRMGLAGGETGNSLDPATTDNLFMGNLTFQLRNCLVEVDHKFNPQPELAESWDASPDAVKWTFKLRKGIEFHNGKTLDSGDVLYSINHHRGKDSKSAAKSLLNNVKEINTDGKHTIVFTLKEGNSDFPIVLSDYHLCIVQADTKGIEFEKGIGTGGYILENFEPGIRAFAKRNPNYWKENRAHFDEVETLNINDSSSRVNAIRSGKLDHIARADTKTAHHFANIPGIEILNVTGTFHFTIPMLTDMVPTENNDVRLALKYAIDRRHILKTIMHGYGAVGNDHPISPKMRYYASDLPQREYDPDKAKYHLKKSGLVDHTFKLYSSAQLEMLDAAILFKEHAAKAGLKFDVVQEPVDGYWNNVWHKKPLSCSFSAGRPTADWMFSLQFAADAAWNEARWKNKRFNNLLIEARSELNENKRHEMYVEMQQIVRNEGGVIIYLFKNNVEAITSNVKHGKLSGLFETDGARNAERWWFSS